jgi:large subunit ribosomal protein L25
MNVVPLTVETGRETGTGNARRMRAEGQLPATVYGLGLETVSVTVERSELRRALTTPAGANALLQLSYSGEQHYALVKEVHGVMAEDRIELELRPVVGTPLLCGFEVMAEN